MPSSDGLLGQGLVAAAALFGATVLGAFAASAGSSGHVQGTHSRLTLVLLNSMDGLPHWLLVYGAVAGFYPSYLWPWTQIFALSSPSWTSGAANCAASLYYLEGKGEAPAFAGASLTLSTFLSLVSKSVRNRKRRALAPVRA